MELQEILGTFFPFFAKKRKMKRHPAQRSKKIGDFAACGRRPAIAPAPTSLLKKARAKTFKNARHDVLIKNHIPKPSVAQQPSDGFVPYK